MDLGTVIFKMNVRAVSDYRVIVDRYVHLLKNFVQNYPEIVYKSLIEQGTDVYVDFKQVLNIIAQLLHQRPQQVTQFLQAVQVVQDAILEKL